jgi:hypothetical protein
MIGLILPGEKTMKDFFSSNTLAFENDLNYHYFSVLVFTFLLLNLGANMKILKLNIFFWTSPRIFVSGIHGLCLSRRRFNGICQ